MRLKDAKIACVGFDGGRNLSVRWKASKSSWDRLKLNANTIFVVEVGDVMDEEYLTIRPVARKGYGSIAHEGEGSDCFSITQLVGQKKAMINSAKKIFIWE